MFFQADQKTKMTVLASEWLRHFRLLCNRWTEFNETWQEARILNLYQVFCFSTDRKTNIAAVLTSDWLIFFDFSATAAWNTTKLDRQQVLNILYQVCGFRALEQQQVSWTQNMATLQWRTLNKQMQMGPLRATEPWAVRILLTKPISWGKGGMGPPTEITSSIGNQNGKTDLLQNRTTDSFQSNEKSTTNSFLYIPGLQTKSQPITIGCLKHN